jgi:hypothetical protein
MTVYQKNLKKKVQAYLERLIAYVESLKETTHTSLDQLLKAQLNLVNSTNDPAVILRASAPETLDRYLKRVEALEQDSTFDGDEDSSQAEIEKASDELYDYLEKVGAEIDKLRDSVTKELVDHGHVGHLAAAEDDLDRNPFLAAVAGHLKATGADASVVIGFKKKTFSELLRERKLRKRWLKTPAGKASLRRAKIRAKRPHTIDRSRSKAARMAHKVYRY